MIKIVIALADVSAVIIASAPKITNAARNALAICTKTKKLNPKQITPAPLMIKQS